MCGSKPKAPPAVVRRDPVAEQAKAEADAQREANAEAAAKRRRRAASGGGLTAAAIRSATLGGSSQQKSLLTQATPDGP